MKFTFLIKYRPIILMSQVVKKREKVWGQNSPDSRYLGKKKYNKLPFFKTFRCVPIAHKWIEPNILQIKYKNR